MKSEEHSSGLGMRSEEPSSGLGMKSEEHSSGLGMKSEEPWGSLEKVDSQKHVGTVDPPPTGNHCKSVSNSDCYVTV